MRNKVMSFLSSNTTETVVDLTDLFDNLKNFLADNGINPDSDWVGVQFIGNTEDPICLSADNTTGTYRELGAVFIHVVGEAKLGASSDILTRAEALRDLFRGANIDGVRVESVSPPNFGRGATIDFEGGWTAASFIVSYEFDRIL